MLKIDNLHVSYGAIQVLWGVSLEVRQNSIAALLGSNGAGKTTTLRTVLGMLHPIQGEVSFKGERITKQPTHEIVKRGLILVPEWRGTFNSLTVLENLMLGAYPTHARPHRGQTLKEVYAIFPRLQERQSQKAGTLSGGERQMLAIGRALMAKPELLILDEPSLGLAPIIVEDIFRVIKQISEEGVSILVVEQHVHKALEVAEHAYIIENGRIIGQGTGEELLQHEQIQEAYLGL